MGANYFGMKAAADEAKKAETLHRQEKDDSKLIKITISVSEEDKRLLAQHRVDTGETASACIRRLIAQELR